MVEFTVKAQPGQTITLRHAEILMDGELFTKALGTAKQRIEYTSAGGTETSCILVPWAEYLARGDLRVLKNNYPMMKKYLKACLWWAGLFSIGKNRYVWKLFHHYGDWCAPDTDFYGWMRRGKWTATACLANSSRIVSKIAGIETTSGGYRTFKVKPVLGGRITWAKADVETPYGRAASDWRIENGKFSITVTVPVSTACELVLPNGESFTLSSGVHHYKCMIGGYR